MDEEAHIFPSKKMTNKQRTTAFTLSLAPHAQSEARRWGQENKMNLASELMPVLPLFILAVAFLARSYFIRKRIIKIHDQLRKKVPFNTNKIDLTGLPSVIKHSSTEEILSKIEAHLNKTENNPNKSSEPT
jgi:hypothetical protein